MRKGVHMKKPNETEGLNQGISIILPAFNEEDNLESSIKDVIDYFDSKERKYEIIVVNDGSTDKTGEIAHTLSTLHENISVIHHSTNKGYGNSLNDGFHAGKCEYLFFTDADRQFRIDSLDKFLPFMEEGKVDMIIGYRIDRKDNPLRKFFSNCFNGIVRILFSLDYKDTDCAFKLFKKGAFESLKIKSDDFLFNAELLAKAKVKKLKIVQLGVDHYPRHGGESTISYKHIFQTLKKLFFLYRELKDFRGKESSP